MADWQHRVVITSERSSRRRWLVTWVVVAALVAGFALYSVTRATAVSDFAAATGERDRLLDERRQLTRDLRVAKTEAETLRDQVAYLSRSQEIDSGACQDVKQSLGQLQAESSDLREQLAFYRGIVSPQESQAGVRVYEFRVSAVKTSPNQYRFDLVLIQPVRSDKRVGGQVELSIEGLKSGKKQTLKLADIAVDGARNLLFSFKYFEEFSGQLKLPEDFRPLRAMVVLQPGGGQAAIEDEYDWKKIIREDAEP
ncbi:DUF6776 family protein [uncultured Nevskia sp.]|uniref:DUF6776 family protein n=1 Tax=uncultured Nevskia sp. TaxID=228950 RepID=UPI0025E93798|nr:DUF6776 family protein [uncultured Nevskia sp.]